MTAGRLLLLTEVQQRKTQGERERERGDQESSGHQSRQNEEPSTRMSAVWKWSGAETVGSTKSSA